MKKPQFVKRKDVYSEEHEQFLKENYHEKGLYFCAKKLHRTPRALCAKAHRMGLSKLRCQNRRKKESTEYSVNPEQFYQILKPEIVYFLGLLWADGSILQSHNRISLTLVHNDFQNIKSILESFGKWKIRNYESSGSRQPIGVAEISNKPLVEFLHLNDYTSKSFKSACKILSHIPPELRYLWFRGLFDGDGNLYFNPDGLHIKFSITSSYNQDWTYMENIFNILNINNFRIKRIMSNKTGFKYSRIEITKRSCILEFLNYVYKDYDNQNIGLIRKYKLFIKCVERDASIKKPKI